MSPNLSDVLSSVERRQKTVVVYSSRDELAVESDADSEFESESESGSDLLSRLEFANATVEHRGLPDGSRGFVVVRDGGDGFVASIGLEDLRTLLEPPIAPPWNRDVPTEVQRALYELFDDTLFSSLDRRQLLGAAREIETRAWQVGAGTLRVGFQRFSAMRDQVPVYIRLAGETDLEIHVYGDADWEPPPLPDVTYHEGPTDEIGRFWFLVYDGGGDDRYACALVAEERRREAERASRHESASGSESASPSPSAAETERGSYFGFWTYDPELVGQLESHLETLDGDEDGDRNGDGGRDKNGDEDEEAVEGDGTDDTDESDGNRDGADECGSGDSGRDDGNGDGDGGTDDNVETDCG